MTIIITITNFLILILISVMVWWRWKERSLNKRLENVILSVPKIDPQPFKVREIKGEIITGSMMEEEELDNDEKPIEVREWENEQRWLNRRKQSES